MAVAPSSTNPNAVTAVYNGGQISDDGNRAPRLPRWTRQEILVLIQGKKVAENRVRRGRTGAAVVGGSGSGSAFGAANQLEPKWASVSSYCKRHGVNRGPVQCRKRWSNLAGDYKKIKEWELQKSGEGESFWVMRNDLRRERKLPGFFDREVFEILDGGVVPPEMVIDEGNQGGGVGPVCGTISTPAAGEEVVFDSGRPAGVDDGLFSDGQEEVEDSPNKEMFATPLLTLPMATTPLPAPLPISEKQYQPFSEANIHQEKHYQPFGEAHTDQEKQHQPIEAYIDQGTTNEKQSASEPEKESTSQEGRKRRRLSPEEDEETSVQDELIKVLDRNGRMLTTQLEAQNTHCELDREQRKDQATSLVAVLGKLADALGRIADKL